LSKEKGMENKRKGLIVKLFSKRISELSLYGKRIAKIINKKGKD
jgi:hypothetical protein